ncbi:MAG TPA: YitT family protein [Armatimonadaceae bacterium]|nr:YitT family protein [Armatimonadaceae bacterium]
MTTRENAAVSDQRGVPDRAGLARRAPRRRFSEPLSPRLAAAADYLLIALGCLVVAATFNLLLNGNRIVAGGVTGLSTLLQGRFGIEPAATQVGLNVPLFLTGTYLLGGRFGSRNLVGILLLPLCVFLTRHFPPLTSNLLLASLYGGIGTGVGLGLIFKGGGSVGGTSLAAQLLSRFLGMSPGAALLVCDGLIIGAASLTLGAEQAMYGLISLFVTKRAIDVIQNGLSTSKLALIICRSESGVEAVRRAVIEDMDRGLTILSGSGGFTGRDRPVLMVVVTQSEVSRLKAHVQAADPDAFVVLADAAEVFGEGFQRYRL